MPITIYGYDTYERITDAKLACLQNNTGYNGVYIGRYLTGTGKSLSLSEVVRLSNAGYKIVSLFELDGTNINSFTKSNGIQHAESAIEAATNLLQPGGTPIYFSIDIEIYDTPSHASKVRKIKDYFDGVIKVFTHSNPKKYLVGVYGLGGSCRIIMNEYSSIVHSWMGHPHDPMLIPGYTIKQDPHAPLSYGGTTLEVDYDTASTPSYGGWKHTHSYLAAWIADGSKHYRKCKKCNYKQYEYHTPDPTGSYCTKCGATGPFIPN